MERAVIVGNCQATALEMMLGTSDEFTRRFEFVSFPPVHEMPETIVPELHDVVGGASIVILQRVDDGYRDGIGLGTETLARLAGAAIVVRWPSVYWAGYFPDLFYLRDTEGQPVVDGPFDYHDRTILQAYVAGLDVASTCRLLEDPDRPSNAPALAASATAELDIRGKGCDVHVAPFIASRFREELLFFTVNHPANRLLGHIAQQIIESIGVPGSIDLQRMPGEVLGSTFYPLHINHVRSLGLEFGAELGAGTTPFRIRGSSHDAADAVQMFFAYYDSHRELVKLNGGRAPA
jgi:Polysaccharide biosynthesis enzyme WcbI